MSSDVIVIRPGKVLDTIQGKQLCCEIGDLLAAQKVNILIDCKNVDFMDSSGLSSLVMGLKKVREAGGNLVLSNTNDQVQMLLKLTAMENVFKIVDNPEMFSQNLLKPENILGS